MARTEGEEVVEVRVGGGEGLEAAAERRLPSEHEAVSAAAADAAAAAAVTGVVGAGGVEAGRRHGVVERPPLQLQLEQRSFLGCLHGDDDEPVAVAVPCHSLV